MSHMHSYGQYCGLAKALDVVGSRWTLLIVRELLIRGACRYTDLREGLPGIATNMLADRLREMEAAGIVTSEAAPAPIAATLFKLTQRGRALEPIVMQLGNWGAPLLAQAPKSDSYHAYWLVLPARLHLTDNSPGLPPVRIEARTKGEAVAIETADGGVRVSLGPARDPDLVLDGPRQAVLGLLLGKLDWAAARRAGLEHQGDPKVLRRVQPRPA
jgi:DNA-binding HxlR family transcriptional regulator